MADAVIRISASRAGSTPASITTREAVPLMPHSVTAPTTISVPVSIREARIAGSLRAVLADSAILPLVTALLAGALAARMAGSATRAFAPSKPLWALGLLLFAAASAAAAYGTADGWGSISFRIYYLTGACLCVAVLGAGSAFLALPRTLALIIFGMTVSASIGATVTVLIAPVDTSAFATLQGLAAPPNSAIAGHASIWAIAMNSVGTLLLIAGAVVSLLRRVRIGPNAAILAGVIVIALAGTLTRFGGQETLYLGQMVGLIVLGAGMEWANRLGYRSGPIPPIAAA